MKKIVFCLAATFLSLTFLPVQLNAANNVDPYELVTTKPEENKEAEEAKTLEIRLNEIKELDKSVLSSSEKKTLRKEVKSINNKLREIGGGVYISAGALILVLILLIVLV